jgi:glycosyltransferase involved in cell wall biosynthesis
MANGARTSGGMTSGSASPFLGPETFSRPIAPEYPVRRRWVINGRFLTQPLTGVQRYAGEIVRRIDRIVAARPDVHRDLEIELLVPPGATTDLGLSAIGIRQAGRGGGHLWEQRTLPAEARGGVLSLCNTGPVTVRRQIVCLHDTNTFNAPGSYAPSFRLAYRLLHPALGRVAARIATVSAYSARELVRHRICAPDRIFLAPNGHEHALGWVAAHSDRTRAAVGPDTVVLVGGHAPHKNTEMIVAMSDRLASAGLRVAIVGMSEPTVFGTGSPRTGAPNVAWLGRVSDGEMAAILTDALCLAFPSLEEGFGLPPLEAMAIGCPVVVSDRASLPEICGDAALVLAPDDSEGWFDAFQRIRHSPALRARLTAAGRRQAARFAWDRSAEAYLRAMAEIDGVVTPAQASSYRDHTPVS